MKVVRAHRVLAGIEDVYTGTTPITQERGNTDVTINGINIENMMYDDTMTVREVLDSAVFEGRIEDGRLILQNRA